MWRRVMLIASLSLIRAGTFSSRGKQGNTGNGEGTPMRIAIGEVMHETNTFRPGITEIEAGAGAGHRLWRGRIL